MTLNDFITKFDFPGSIVLLEGKRIVKPGDEPKLEQLGALLARTAKHVQFRSGNAEGSDQLFSTGVSSVDKMRLEVIVPYSKHRTKTNTACKTYSLDEINLASEPEVVYQSRKNKKTEKLVDKYIEGNRDRFSIKAAYIIRDTVKAIGTREIKPTTFGIFYDDLANPREGGTGHTMKTCQLNDIPFVDQRIWMNWLKQNAG